MAFDLRLILGNGKQNLRHTVSDVVLHHILDEKHGYEHTYARIDKVKEVIQFSVKPRGQSVMDIKDRELEGNSCQTARHSDEQSEYNHDVPLRQPVKELSER